MNIDNEKPENLEELDDEKKLKEIDDGLNKIREFKKKENYVEVIQGEPTEELLDILKDKDILKKIEEWKKDGSIKLIDDEGNEINIKYAHVIPYDSPCYEEFEKTK